VFAVGLVIVFHLVPSHLIIVPAWPTAHPSVELTISTDSKSYGVGLVTVFHLVPSQWIIVPSWPTAHPSLELTISTDHRMFSVGLVTVFQRAPCTFSISKDVQSENVKISRLAFTQKCPLTST